MDIAPVDEATLDPHESMLAGSIQPRIDLAQRGVADAAQEPLSKSHVERVGAKCG
jgi:hypothetical protein